MFSKHLNNIMTLQTGINRMASQLGFSPDESSNVYASRLGEQISLNTVSSCGVFHLNEISNVSASYFLGQTILYTERS